MYESEEAILLASMGTFAGHIIPGSSLALLGLWHTINTIKAYHLKSSTNFRSSYWYPFEFHLIPSLKYLELLFVLTFSILAIIMQILDFPFIHFTFKLNNFEHATMFLHLAIFSGFTLFSEFCSCSDVLTGVSGILATSVFSQELFLLHYHSADHVGLEGHYHWLLQIIVLVSVVACLVTVLCPDSFPAALVLAVTVVFQGCWFVNMGFMLWDHRFVPEGCVMMKNMSSSDVGNSSMHDGAVLCEGKEADFRARGLANLQFSWILGGILIVVGIFTCFKFARRNLFGQSSSNYQQLRCRVATSATAADGSVSMTNLKTTFPISCC
ncbi:transmembrane protein 45B [Impatiens glandulifera]|uniref:transmembrane protein 45B n=1 Tax=Impatiens glandulifera TaxID=253017 RepID=UPI001FB07C63|nr:transmembrane protein 45B [Impatiens glandulifera]